MASNKSSTDENTEQDDNVVVEKEQVYDKLKSKVEILDILFHPSETNLINLALINGKLKMYDFKILNCY